MVDNQGGVDISYMTEECNTSLAHGIFMRRSTNGGASFGPAQKINKPGQWEDNPDPDDLLPPKNARLPASTSAPLVFNPVDNSLNYIVQNNINRATSGADISFTKSLDYGNTWSDMTTVSVNGSGEPGAAGPVLPVDGRRPRGRPARDLVRQPQRPRQSADRDLPGRFERWRRDLGEPRHQHASRGTRT